MSKNAFKINEEDYKNLIGKSGLIFLKSLGRAINTSWISEIVPEYEYNLELRENRIKSTNGMLHDGTSVIRHFGRWYLSDGSFVADENGKATKPEKEIDPLCYPEVARDCVPTITEYEQKYAQIPNKEKRLEMILSIQGRNDDKLESGIKKLL